eukprot:COSAG02_NODE_1137_length_14313_cov_6.111369_20_plen_197_part_00
MTAGGFKYRRFGNEKLPEEAHLLVLAGRCSTYGAQREPLMLIAVRGGASRCFQRRKARSAALSRRLRRCVPPCAAAAAFPSLAARSRPFDPAAVRLSRLFCAPTRLFVCIQLVCRLAGREGRGVASSSSRSSAASWAMPAAHTTPSPRATGRSTRPLRGEIACSLRYMTCCVVVAVRRVKGGDRNSGQGLRARDWA